MQNITLKKLAKDLKLSISTVSKALNDSFEISEETKRRVQEYALVCNYKPNILASSLKSGKSHTLALIIPFLSNPFLSQLLEGAQHAAYENNYRLIFMQSNESPDSEKECLEFLQSQNIDGILITPSANSDIEFLKEFHQKIPLVLADRIDFDIDTFKVGVNSEEGTFLATQYLINQGIKKIYLLAGDKIGISERRILGYKKGLYISNLDWDENQIIKVNYGQSRTDLIANLTDLLQRKLQKTSERIGILSTTDTLTVLTLSILSKLNIDVPNQVSLLGFSNTLDAEAMNPALSTIVQPAKEMGYVGIKKLIKLIKSKNRFEEDFGTILLNTEIVIRKSS